MATLRTFYDPIEPYEAEMPDVGGQRNSKPHKPGPRGRDGR